MSSSLTYYPPSPTSPTAPTSTEAFTLSTTSPTDIWRKPPSHNVFNAPTLYHTLPVKAFKSARLTCSAKWTTLYDQGGLLLVFPPKRSSSTSSSASSGSGKNDPLNRPWLKTGIEYYHSAPRMSVVAADTWADWSLLPLPTASEAAGKMTVEVEREREKDGSWGSVLRVSTVGEGGERFPIREVTWAFWDVDEDAEMWVGAFVARPTKPEKEEGDLEVRFEGFEVDRRGVGE